MFVFVLLTLLFFLLQVWYTIWNVSASIFHFYHAYFQILLQNCDEKQKQNLLFGYHMMVDEDKMGERFKLFSLFPSVLKEHLARFPVSGFVDS